MGFHQYLAVVSVNCTFRHGGSAATRKAAAVVSVEELNMLFFQIGSMANGLIEELSQGKGFFGTQPDTVLSVKVASAQGVALREEGFSEAFTLSYGSSEHSSLYVVLDREMRKQILDYLRLRSTVIPDDGSLGED